MRHFKKAALLLLLLLLCFRSYPVFAFTAGDRYEVYRDIPSYEDSYSAADGTGSTGVRPAGSYFIYKASNEMLNLSKEPGIPGFWMNPKDNQPPPEETLLVTDRYASMRSGPGSTYRLIKTLAPGTPVLAGEASGNYTSVVWNGISGYVYTAYLTRADAHPFQELKITGEVTFRKGPGTGYSSIGKISRGTIVRNLEEVSGKYIKINHKGTAGWVSSYYIDAVRPVYKQGILFVNKRFPLPSSLVPGTSDDAALSKLSSMRQAYRAQTGRTLSVIAGYRSYSEQKAIFERNEAKHGFTRANSYSARPGYSEHQTGLAFDLNGTDSLTRLKPGFKYTREYKWLMANAHKYGFILRYPEGKSTVTGYIFEPWHFRYIGPVMAGKVRSSGLCLEEYLRND